MNIKVILNLLALLVGIFSLGPVKAQNPYDFCDKAFLVANPQKWCSEETQFSTFDASHSGSELATCFANFGKDVWFKFVAVGTVLKITIKSTGARGKTMNQPEFVLFTGDCESQISLMGCARSRPGRKFVAMRKNDLIPGQTYLISVQDAQQEAGFFQICLRNYSPKTITKRKIKKKETHIPEFSSAIKKGMEFHIKNLRFDANSFEIKSSFLPALFEIVHFLKRHANVVIEIGGHTNSNCDDIYCQALSHNRAKAIANFILSKKVDPMQIQFRGYGKTKPISTNLSAIGQAKNQRVAIKIIQSR